MKHYVRFVRSIAISGTVFACASGDDSTQKTTQPQTASSATKAGATSDAGPGDLGSATQDVADAAALVDAKNSPKSSGPLAPPEMPSTLAA
jgi:hypothetical protein